jgi:hypothetical protein
LANILIDRLSITLMDRSSGDGERLAHLIAEKLAAASFSAPASENRDTVNVAVPGASGSDLDQLAEKVVDDLVRQISRSA